MKTSKLSAYWNKLTSPKFLAFAMGLLVGWLAHMAYIG